MYFIHQVIIFEEMSLVVSALNQSKDVGIGEAHTQARTHAHAEREREREVGGGRIRARG